MKVGRVKFFVFAILACLWAARADAQTEAFPSPSQSPFLYFNLFQNSPYSGYHTYLVPQQLEYEADRDTWTDIRRIQSQVQSITPYYSYDPSARQSTMNFRGTAFPYPTDTRVRRPASRFNDCSRYYPGLR